MGKNLSERFVSKRVKWTDDELKLVLAYYFFIYQYNTRKQDYHIFTEDLRSMTGNDRSVGSVGVRFGNFISVDPSKTSQGFKNADKKCGPIWKQCINPDRTPKEEFIKYFIAFVEKYGKCKNVYLPFLSQYNSYRTLKCLDEDDREGVITTNDLLETESFEPSYKPEEVPLKNEGSTKRYKRNSAKAKGAIILSGFQCSIDSKHESFVAKNNKPYMEAHHLIPMSAQENFDVSLDVDANIVSLCPVCHRKLHHGKEIENDLRTLFDKREALLKESGINITFKELKQYYL